VADSWNRYNGHISIVPPHRSIRVGAWDSITELDILVQGNYKNLPLRHGDTEENNKEKWGSGE